MGFLAPKDLFQRVCFSQSFAGVLEAISDKASMAQDKIEASFFTMLIFDNNLSISLHRLTFSWKCDCFTISFQSREWSSSVNSWGAIIPQRSQASSSPSQRKTPYTAAVEGCAPTITNCFSSKCVRFASTCFDRCPSCCASRWAHMGHSLSYLCLSLQGLSKKSLYQPVLQKGERR